MLTGEEHGFRASNGVHEGSNTLLRIVYDEANSRLKVKLLRDGREITDKCAASAFVWTKNGAAAGTGREIAVTAAEVNGDVQFGCAYTETQGVYGTVSVDNNLVASHDPAATDANHVFTLENGMLKVEAPDNAGSSADYALNDGTLSINPGFTGTIAAAYEFTTAPTREIDFKYDHNGLRTQKKVVENGVTTTYDYTLHGKLITHLTKRVVDLEGEETTEELHFFYDAQSRPAFVEYEGTMYRYTHNLQGDIAAIVDANGTLVVEYKYDVWGKPISITRTLKTTLGELNPFRYRGYVYDEETGLYYLRSRYYNPTVRRFLNADAVEYVEYGMMLNNLFAYCSNAATVQADEDGEISGFALGFLAEAVTFVKAAVASIVAAPIVPVAAVCLGLVLVAWTIDNVATYINNARRYDALREAAEQTAEKSLSKSQEKVHREQQRYDYWIAKRVVLENGIETYIPTVGISEKIASSVLRSGGNVFASSRTKAKKLALAAGTGKEPIKDPRHYNRETGSNLGYLRHYHEAYRRGGHVFYL